MKKALAILFVAVFFAANGFGQLISFNVESFTNTVVGLDNADLATGSFQLYAPSAGETNVSIAAAASFSDALTLLDPVGPSLTFGVIGDTPFAGFFGTAQGAATNPQYDGISTTGLVGDNLYFSIEDGSGGFLLGALNSVFPASTEPISPPTFNIEVATLLNGSLLFGEIGEFSGTNFAVPDFRLAPEPGAFALIAGALGLVALRRRRRA